MNLETDDKEFQKIHELRKIMGTLPSERPVKKTEFKTLEQSLEITLEDYSTNPYRAIFTSCTSTWGDDDFKQKWPITSPEGKFEVLKAAFCHATLPQCKEAVMFTFRVKGTPRWLFDYHAQTVNFCFFMSSGVRDNSRLDASIVKDHFSEKDKEIYFKLKDLYEFTLGSDQGSWQSARSFLPLSFAHHYHFGQNLLSIVSTRGFHANGRFKNNYEDQSLLIIYKEVAKQIGKKFPLLELYLSMMWNDQQEVMNKIKSLTINQLDEKDFNLLNKNEL